MTHSKKIRAVMFDLDGTLLDTAPDFVAVVNQLLVENECEELPEDVIRNCVSNGSKALVKLAFQIEESHDQFNDLRNRLLELYTDHIAVLTKPFPGIVDLLSNLESSNIAWGIATNKPAAYTTPLMEKLNMQPPPAVVICPDHVQHTKPAPESLYVAAKALGCEPDEIIYIGDHERDIQCGQSAGSITIAAAYGYVGDENIDAWKADYRVNHAREIWPIIQRHL